MKLNDAKLLNRVIDGVECSTIKEFIYRLKESKNLLMKIYINTKLVCSGSPMLRSDNEWIIASINSQFSLNSTLSVESIVARITQGDTILFESVTPCNTIVSENDTVASFHMCLINDSPYNELKKNVPDSRLVSKLTDKLTPLEFDSLSGINDNTNIEPVNEP